MIFDGRDGFDNDPVVFVPFDGTYQGIKVDEG